MNPQDHTGAATKSGPITRIHNGRGVRPWLPELICEPGYVYLVAEAMTMYRPQGPARRVCARCVRPLQEHFEGHASVEWEETPPDPAERCPRCERSFGERPA